MKIQKMILFCYCKTYFTSIKFKLMYEFTIYLYYNSGADPSVQYSID